MALDELETRVELAKGNPKSHFDYPFYKTR